ADHLGQNIGAVAGQAYRDGLLLMDGVAQNANGFVEAVDQDVAVAGLAEAVDALGVRLDAEKGGAVQGGGEGLGAAPAAHTSRNHQFAGQGAAEVLPAGGGERLVGDLQSTLRADVGPASGGRVGGGDQDARRQRVGPENTV